MIRNFKVNSELLPKNFPREFDAHIYFDESNRAAVQALYQKMKNHFDQKAVFIGEMIDHPIGPHPHAMFEANFSKDYFADVVLWLMKEHQEISILVHRLTGNDYVDHTNEALWIGPVLQLNLSIFSPPPQKQR